MFIVENFTNKYISNKNEMKMTLIFTLFFVIFMRLIITKICSYTASDWVTVCDQYLALTLSFTPAGSETNFQIWTPSLNVLEASLCVAIDQNLFPKLRTHISGLGLTIQDTGPAPPIYSLDTHSTYKKKTYKKHIKKQCYTFNAILNCLNIKNCQK